MIARRIIAVLIVAVAVPAYAEAPLRSPRPAANPGSHDVAAVSTMGTASALAVRAALRPRLRPAADETVAAAATPVVAQPARKFAIGSLFPLQVVPRPAKKPKLGVTGAEIEDVAYRSQPGRDVVIGRKGSVCGDPALRGAEIAPIAAKLNGCGLVDGVKLTSVDGIPLSTPASVDCKTALAFRAWVTEGLKPAVGKRGGGVAEIRVAGSYACRPRNNQRGEKISEHGRGRALDISGFILKDGEVITVLRDWGKGKQGEILLAAHWLACRTFGTVLGPSANRFHRDHFHFDTARNRSGSYCK